MNCELRLSFLCFFGGFLQEDSVDIWLEEVIFLDQCASVFIIDFGVCYD